MIEKYIKEIIKENEYNIENYNLLLKKNSVQEEEIIHLKEQLDTSTKKITELTSKIEKIEECKKKIRERANNRLKEISLNNPEKIKEYRKTAYEKNKKIKLENNLKATH